MDTNLTPPVSRTVLAKGSRFDFEQITVRKPGGAEFRREFIRHPGAVVVVPLLEEPGLEPRIAFVRNARWAIGRYLLELPAGTLEPGEAPELCAGRELVEETGYRADRIISLASFYTSPGLSDELMWAFVATGLTHVGQQLEADEDLSVELIPARRVGSLMESGELADGKSLAALLLARARGLIPS